MSSGVTTRLGVRPSKVAALMTRLRNVTGPSRAGEKASAVMRGSYSPVAAPASLSNPSLPA